MKSSFWTSPLSLPLRFTSFVLWFFGQFVVTSLQVVSLILTPGRRATPGIVKLGTEELTETEVTVLVLLITITPDTLVIAVDRDAKALFVHGMFVNQDADAFKASLRKTHDKLLMGVRTWPEMLRSGDGA